MIRYLALLAIHFLVNFALLGTYAIVAHPIHHDDYSILGGPFRWEVLLGARPLSGLVIAGLGALGGPKAYLLLNLLVAAVVWLAIRFAELFLRDGRRLPAGGFLAVGLIALSYPAIADWSRYLGLITNLSSAIPGLVAMCLLAKLSLGVAHPWLCRLAVVALAAISFFAKEDFALPILATAACLAFLERGRAMYGLTAAIAGLYAVSLLFNHMVGSAFVSGGDPGDPYATSFTPLSVLYGMKTLLLHTWHGRWVTVLACGAALLLAIVRRRDRSLLLRSFAMLAAAVSVLLPYAVLPNHLMPYYSFVTVAMLASGFAAFCYALLEAPDGRLAYR